MIQKMNWWFNLDSNPKEWIIVFFFFLHSLSSSLVSGMSRSRLESGVDVFNIGEAGYFCIKIPYLFVTFKGTLLAFAEARMISCSDYTWTDLVYKRSEDGGKTWGNLTVLYTNSTPDYQIVIGNAAPVQDRTTNRILVPFCRNNFDVMLTYSDDDGRTWSKPVNLTDKFNLRYPEWHWIGTGPPASVQLESGRIVVPTYHSYFHYDDGDISHSHMILSDDHGTTWRLGGFLEGLNLSNENQAVDLGNNVVLVNARGFGAYRLEAISKDGGETFGDVVERDDMVSPFTGCEGSIIRYLNTSILFFSNPHNPSFLRYNMTVLISKNFGRSWDVLKVIYEGRSAYSALAVLQDGSVGLLYEWSTKPDVIFLPEHITFEIVWRP